VSSGTLLVKGKLSHRIGLGLFILFTITCTSFISIYS
jgi:hypothetical protein